MNNVALGGDFIQETTTLTTTGDIILPDVADVGYEKWSYWFLDGNRVPYAITDKNGHWEVGIGTYTAATHHISRDTIWWSSNAGAAVDFTGIAAQVYSGPNSGGSGLSIQFHWLGYGSDPTTSTDIAVTADIGSFYVRQDTTFGDALFICVDPAPGAARWVRIPTSPMSNGITYYTGSNVLGGQHNSIDVINAVIHGLYGDNYLSGSLAIGAAEPTSPVAGQHQFHDLPLALRTTDATTTAMVMNGSTSTHMTLPASTAWWVTIDVLAWDAANNLASGWHLQSLVKRNGSGTPTIVGSTSATAIEQDASASAWTVAAAIDSGNNALVINCTGAAAHTISWTGTLRITQAK